jgi:antibiotic biosynthesis monooxygenase (ABM) superfamily enzyme
MNGNTESRERHAPQPATALASHRVRADKVAEYLEAQKAITDAARRFDGFVGTEVLGPVAGAARRRGRDFPARIKSSDETMARKP